jgi:hypothetical protein
MANLVDRISDCDYAAIWTSDDETIWESKDWDA